MKDIQLPARGHLRRLTNDEIELWLEVTQSVARRAGIQVPELNRATPKTAAKADAVKPVAAGAPAPVPPPPAGVPRLAPLERRARQRLARGHMPVDAAIDLHGMSQHEAHVALHGFLGHAQRTGAKIVLVVTGKGDAHPIEGFETGGVLRRSVPLWLRAPEWRSMIVGFEEASRPHGGAGALYVRIRRWGR